MILFIHGYTASSQADFYPALVPLLKDSKIKYYIPDLPGDEHPHADAWLQKINSALKDRGEPLTIFGHSLGTRAALLYIEKFQQKVENLFLIAAFANRRENAKRKGGTAYPDFFDHLLDVQKIKKLVNHTYVLHSQDDSSIPFEQGKEIAKDLSAELIISKNKDHFCDSSNASYIFSVLKEKIGF